MAGRGVGPDFVEALARGLSVLSCFDARHPRMTLTEIAAAADLARPTARRLLLTLQELGYVRAEGGSFALTPRVLGLGMAYVNALGLWDIARPHMESLVASTKESSSMSQLDGSDIVLRRTGRGSEDHHLAGEHRDQVPGGPHLAGQGAAGRAGRDGAGRRPGAAE